jgi:hypothetical protein
MPEKLIINVEELIELFKFKCKIESFDLKDIEFRSKGQPVFVSPEEIEEWKFIGLSNYDFAKFNLFKEIDPNLEGLGSITLICAEKTNDKNTN